MVQQFLHQNYQKVKFCEIQKSGLEWHQENENQKIEKKLILIKILVKTIFWGPIFNFRGRLSTKIKEIQGVTRTPWSSRLQKPKPWTHIY